MTTDEIKALEKTFGRATPEWRKAFNEYNTDQNNKKLSMNCRSCWMKVLQWQKKQNEKN